MKKQMQNNTPTKSTLIQWIDEKAKKMNEALKEVFTLDENCNYHLVIIEIMSYDNDFDSTRTRDFNSGQEVLYCFRLFQALIGKINRHMTFIPTKENFCMFMGWTAKTYQRMVSESSDEVKEAMEVVNDYLVEAMLSAGMSGKTNTTITKFRSQVAGEHGLNLVTEKEKASQNKQTDTMLSKEELIKKLESFGVASLKTDANLHTPSDKK